MEGSLALILFVAIVTGVIIALLLVLPSLIRDAYMRGTAKTE
jgi:energy-converting hydrogenase Eha subunit A